ncbi:hypothetical protein [Streptomyces tricolor]
MSTDHEVPARWLTDPEEAVTHAVAHALELAALAGALAVTGGQERARE